MECALLFYVVNDNQTKNLGEEVIGYGSINRTKTFSGLCFTFYLSPFPLLLTIEVADHSIVR